MYYMCVFNMWTSLVTQTVKNLPAVQETWVQSLDRKYPPEREMAIHSSILAWRILWTEEPGRLQHCMCVMQYVVDQSEDVSTASNTLTKLQGFPGGPVVKTPFFRCMGTGLIPGQETRIPHATQRGQKTRNIKTHKQQRRKFQMANYCQLYFCYIVSSRLGESQKFCFPQNKMVSEYLSLLKCFLIIV